MMAPPSGPTTRPPSRPSRNDPVHHQVGKAVGLVLPHQPERYAEGQRWRQEHHQPHLLIEVAVFVVKNAPESG